jgi:hypothetical protein
MSDLRQRIYEAMIHEPSAQAEWGDNDEAIYNEVMTADDEIIAANAELLSD